MRISRQFINIADYLIPIAGFAALVFTPEVNPNDGYTLGEYIAIFVREMGNLTFRAALFYHIINSETRHNRD